MGRSLLQSAGVILASLIVAISLVVLIEMLSGWLYPFPEGVDPLHIALGFPKRRDPAVLSDIAGPGIVGRERVIDPPEGAQLDGDVFGAALQVVVDIVGVHAHILGGARHELR